jgi:anti-sigma factor RsiW
VAELTCKELVELVTEYLEGAMPGLERRAFEDHVQRCDGCDAYLEQMRETLRLVGTLTEASLSADAEADLLVAFHNWKAQRQAGA